jgi:hypothetical protein
MKVCSICNQTYSDENLNFCLSDGGLLIQQKDDAPPTILMNEVRTTQPNWGEYEAASTPWQNQPLQQTNQSQFPNQPFYPSGAVRGQDQTLPTISLILGILGIMLFCCYGGFPLGLAAAVTGYLGLQNTNKDPMQYGGRNLAIAGIILGAIAFLINLLLVLFGILASLF